MKQFQYNIRESRPGDPITENTLNAMGTRGWELAVVVRPITPSPTAETQWVFKREIG
jgi:hypothetical protein